jgi:DNA-binding transcriptional regulator YiaG
MFVLGVSAHAGDHGRYLRRAVMTPTELYQRRLAIGVKQSGLAELLGVHVITVSKWERGVVPVPSWLHLALWAIEHNAPSN